MEDDGIGTSDYEKNRQNQVTKEMNKQAELCVCLGHILQEKQWRLVTAESCTGGGIAQAVTAIAGSSSWCEGGFVTYSNKMKEKTLGVASRASFRLWCCE